MSLTERQGQESGWRRGSEDPDPGRHPGQTCCHRPCSEQSEQLSEMGKGGQVTVVLREQSPFQILLLLDLILERRKGKHPTLNAYYAFDLC